MTVIGLAARREAIAREITGQGPLVEMAAYLLGLDGREHAEAACWAREVLAGIDGALEAFGRVAA
jgi:hypothetical protein